MNETLEENSIFEGVLKDVEVTKSEGVVTAQRTMTVSGEIFEKFGKVFISWEIPTYYPMHNDRDQFIELYEGNSIVSRLELLSHSGEYNTGKPFGSGYHFELSVFTSYPKDRYMQVLKSSETK